MTTLLARLSSSCLAQGIGGCAALDREHHDVPECGGVAETANACPWVLRLPLAQLVGVPGAERDIVFSVSENRRRASAPRRRSR